MSRGAAASSSESGAAPLRTARVDRRDGARPCRDAAVALAALLLAGCAFRVPAPMTGATVDMARVFPSAVDPRPYVSDGGDVWFVDTGAARTTCDDDFVAARGLVPRGSPSRAVGQVGVVAERRVVLRDVTLGGWTFRRLPCAVRDLGTTSSVLTSAAAPVAGIVGANVLRHFALELDARAARLRRGRVTVGGARLRPEGVVGPRLVVEVRAADVRTAAVVDTGADRTYLPVRVGPVVDTWRGTRSATGGQVTVNVEERGGTVLLDGMPAGIDRWIVHDDALLGMDALGGVDLLVVDWPARRLVVEER